MLLAFGYYDTATLDRIVSMVGRGASVSIVLNGLGGPALDEQVQELRAFVVRHQRLRPEVHLYFSPAIFHPKLIVAVRAGSSGTAWVGSANATAAAFPGKRERNQELMVELRGDVSALCAYFRSVRASAVPLAQVGKKEVRIETLPAFFRAGALAFKPTNQLQLSFNPFAPLIRGLRDQEKEALGAQTVRNAEATTGIGAFNVARAVDLTETDFEDSADARVTKVSPLAFGFETAFGYWIPSASLSSFRERMQKGVSGKQAKLKLLADRVARAGSVGLLRRYVDYLEDVETAFRSAGLGKVVGGSGSKRLFDVEGGQAFLDRCIRSMASDDFVTRHSRAFFISPVPEIWDDTRLTRIFVSSFFEGILGAHLKASKGARLHVQRVLAACSAFEGEKAADADGLEKCFRRYLHAHGWTDRDWEAPRE